MFEYSNYIIIYLICGLLCLLDFIGLIRTYKYAITSINLDYSLKVRLADFILTILVWPLYFIIRISGLLPRMKS